jgi:hypothetical protein
MTAPMMIKSVNRSALDVPPLLSEKKIKSTVPSVDAIQKDLPGCFLFMITAIIAVTKGMTAAITDTCADVVLCRAIAIKIGHPNTAPSAVKAVGLQRWRGSAGTLKMNMSGIAKKAAIIGRAKAVKSGSKLLSANFVKGSESENARTPKKAKRRPLR